MINRILNTNAFDICCALKSSSYRQQSQFFWGGGVGKKIEKYFEYYFPTL